MATSVANPQASAPAPPPQPGAGNAPPQQQQANGLQIMLAQAANQFKRLGQQNEIIQDQCEQVFQIILQMLQTVSQASAGPPVQPSAPPQAG